MKRKLIITLTAILLVAFAIPAFAAMSDTQKAEVDGLYGEMKEIRKQIIQKYVEAGEITPEQGQQMQERMDQMPADGIGGCGGPGGPGMMGGSGRMGGFNSQATGYEI